jgi:hypothetical protein
MELHQSHNQFEFTPEQLEVLRNHTGMPLHVPVKQTSKIYLVIEEGVIPTLDEEYIRQGLEHAAEQVRRGEVAEFSAEEIKAAGREMLAQRGRPS